MFLSWCFGGEPRRQASQILRLQSARGVWPCQEGGWVKSLRIVLGLPTGVLGVGETARVYLLEHSNTARQVFVGEWSPGQDVIWTGGARC